MKLPFPGRAGQRSPLHFPLFPLGGPRRWSEAAAIEVSGSEGNFIHNNLIDIIIDFIIRKPSVGRNRAPLVDAVGHRVDG